jgi:ectoine hydroxylase-related dioxygenase (phytanoyl-CoA dioxygenase family)
VIETPSLRDPALEAALERDGFVVVEDLVGEDLAERLHQRYREVHPTDVDDPARSPAAPGAAPMAWERQPWPGSQFLTGVNEMAGTDRAPLEAWMAPVWDEVLEDLLVDHEVLITSFLMKWPGADGVMPPHQDPTFTDERRHRSLTVWIALDDATTALDNGPLHVVRGSHEAGWGPRGSGIVPGYLDDLEATWAAAEPVDVRRGTAIVLDTRVVHGSAPNRSPSPRLALAASCVPRGIQLVSAIRDDDADEVRLVAVDAELYRTSSPMEIRDAPPVHGETVAVLVVPRAAEADPEPERSEGAPRPAAPTSLEQTGPEPTTPRPTSPGSTSRGLRRRLGALRQRLRPGGQPAH